MHITGRQLFYPQRRTKEAGQLSEAARLFQVNVPIGAVTRTAEDYRLAWGCGGNNTADYPHDGQLDIGSDTKYQRLFTMTHTHSNRSERIGNFSLSFAKRERSNPDFTVLPLDCRAASRLAMTEWQSAMSSH